jgi:hypothetical protein
VIPFITLLTSPEILWAVAKLVGEGFVFLSNTSLTVLNAVYQSKSFQPSFGKDVITLLQQSLGSGYQ